MKKVFALVLALMLALSLMACSQPAEQDETSTDTTNSSTETPNTNDAEDQEDVSSDNTTITLWTVFTGSDGDILRRIISEYNEANTDGITVEIDIMDNATLQSKLPAAISTGTGPSFVLVGIEYIQQYVDNGLLESIDDFWDVTGIDKSNFYENVLAKSYVDDTLYGVPMQYNLQYLYYNKDAFTDAGLDPEAPPTTLDELQEYAIALTDPASGRYGLGLASDYGYYVQFLWGFGGDCILSSENPWYCHKNSLVVANRIPWSLPNKIPGSATLLHPHEGVSQAVAWTIKSNQVAMVGQTVNHGSRHLVIGKNGAPFGKLQIGGNDQAAPFVAA